VIGPNTRMVVAHALITLKPQRYTYTLFSNWINLSK
jgi:hypothetical protein